MGRRSIYTQSKTTEKKEINVLGLILSDNLIHRFTPGDDTYPDTDGHIQLLASQRQTTGLNLEVQIKPISYTKKGIPVAKCPSKLLRYATSSNVPLLFFAVDVEKQIAYWHYISKEMAVSILEEGKPVEEKSIVLNKDNIIKKGEESYLKPWKDICNHHINKVNDFLIEEVLSFPENEAYPSSAVLIEKIKTLGKLGHYRSIKGKHIVVPSILRIGHKFISDIHPEEKVIKEYLETLDVIRYHEPKEVFNVLFSLSSVEENIKLKSIFTEKLRHLASYNYHALLAYGYGPQGNIVDVIENLPLQNKINNLDVVKGAYEALLEPSFEGTSTKGNVLNFHRGPLTPTPFWEKLRRRVIKDVLQIFKNSSLPEKLKVLDILVHSAQTPQDAMPEEQKEKIFKIIQSNLRYWIKEIKLIILKDQKIGSDLLLLLKLEQQLGWVYRVHGKNVPEVGILLKKLQEDKGIYGLYRLLIGEVYQLRADDDYLTAEREWKTAIGTHTDALSVKNVKKYIKDLSRIIKAVEGENGHFINLVNFLVGLGKKKPALAKIIIVEAVKGNLPIKNRLAELVGGIRNSGEGATLDPVIDFLVNTNDPECAIAIAASFIHLEKGNLDKVADKDIFLLEDFILRKEKFNSPPPQLNNRNLFAVLYGVLRLSSLKPKEGRRMFLELIKNYPEQVVLYLSTIDFALQDQMFSLGDWSKAELSELSTLLVKISSLDYHGVHLLLALGEADFDLLIDIFYKRMLEKRSRTTQLDFSYQAVPRDINELKPLFEKNREKFKNIVKMWSKKHLGQTSVFSINLSSFLERFAPAIAKEIITDLIKSGKKKELLEAADLLPQFEGIDLEFCLQLIQITDDKRIRDILMGNLTNTGVATGAAGENILGQAWKRRVDELKALESKVVTKKAKDFLVEAIVMLEKMIERSEKDHQAEQEREKRREREQEE